MSDAKLRNRLAAIAGMVFDDNLLDTIHHRLMTAPDGAKVPIPITYRFSIDEYGELNVEITAKATFDLTSHKFRLASDGNQLKLLDVPLPGELSVRRELGEVVDNHGQPEDDDENEDLQEESPMSQDARRALNDIIESNTRLYEEGAITRKQAIEGGVDVDSVDSRR